MREQQRGQLPTGVLVTFALVFPAGLVFAPILAFQAVADWRKVPTVGVVVETRIVYDHVPSRFPAKWCKEWLVDYGEGRNWFRVRRYLNRDEVEVDGDIGKQMPLWRGSGGVTDVVPDPERKAFGAVFAGVLGFAGAIAVYGVIRRLAGWDPPPVK